MFFGLIVGASLGNLLYQVSCSSIWMARGSLKDYMISHMKKMGTIVNTLTGGKLWRQVWGCDDRWHRCAHEGTLGSPFLSHLNLSVDLKPFFRSSSSIDYRCVHRLVFEASFTCWFFISAFSEKIYEQVFFLKMVFTTLLYVFYFGEISFNVLLWMIHVFWFQFPFKLHQNLVGFILLKIILPPRISPCHLWSKNKDKCWLTIIYKWTMETKSFWFGTCNYNE